MGFHKYFMSPSSVSNFSDYKLHNWNPVPSRRKNFSYCQHVSTNSRAHKSVQLVTGTYTCALKKYSLTHFVAGFVTDSSCHHWCSLWRAAISGIRVKGMVKWAKSIYRQ
jgi:hypothetical protein